MMVTDGEIPGASEELLERLEGARAELGLQVRERFKTRVFGSILTLCKVFGRSQLCRATKREVLCRK